ncbi:MAG: BACON domain-containing protein [Bacteroidales bacterium]|nr:BACON domain-containing protein [Bacteroidales bacterium]
MKLINICKGVAALAVGALLLGCSQKEQDVEARAVAAAETSLTFEATGAPAQTVKVYADGTWAVDTPDAWIHVSPMSGKGMGEVTVTVDDNVSGGVMDLPRTGSILIQGGSVERRGSITVQQGGDTYKGVSELTVKEVCVLDDEAVAKIPSAQVAAVTTGGFVLTQDGENLYVQGAREVSVGDNVSLNGKKGTFNKCPTFFVDELTVVSSGSMTYPEAPDMTDQLASFQGGSIPYITLRGSMVNGSLKVGPASVVVVDPVDDLGLADVDLHKVVLTGYAVGINGATGYLVATSVKDEGKDESLIPYPLRWAIGKDLNYSSSTFTKDSPRIDAVQGIGYIEYVPYDLENTDASGNYKLDVQASNPRVTGPWVNDYWLFYGSGAILAGTEVQISFEMRSSAWGMKYWLLEYLDGDEWKVAGTPQVTTEPGYEVQYHVATNADGATNSQVREVIQFRRNNEHLQIRMRCSALWRGGGGTTASRSTASSRLTITNVDDDTYRPAVIILKEGNGVEKDPVYADIQADPELLTFNGTPGAPKTITVKSDYDWTISTAYEWLHLDVEGGVAGEETTVTVTCDESELSELREGTIRIVSEDSEKVINVVQSAAGQMLDPFISISTGNLLEVNAEEGESDIKVQYNTEYEVQVDADWLTLTPVTTRALVEWDEYVLTRTANESEAPRTGTVRFYNDAKKLEAVVTVVQEGKEVIFDNNLIQWGFDAALMDSYKDSFEKDNSFKSNVAGVGYLSWHNLPESVAADTDGKKSQLIGGTGQPYVTGVWPGDYWEFTFPVRNVPAGNVVTFSALHRISGTGQKYWRMDWSVDGTTWTPVKALETETETGTNAQYTHIAPTSDILLTESFKLPEAIAEGDVRIRFTCVANWQGNGKGALKAPNGGTHRWSGTAETGPKITVTEPQVTEYFADDFEWLEPWAAYTVDDVGSNSVGSAPNAFTKAEVAGALAELQSRGYGYIWGWKDQDWSDGLPDSGNKQTLYFMHNYLKFGKTSCNSGIILPALTGISGSADVDLTFDWCWCMTGKSKPDIMTLTVTVTGGGRLADTGTEVSGNIESAQPTEGDLTKLEWQHVKVRILGATPETRITIRPTNNDPKVTSSRDQNRWYLDNIRVVSE